MDNENKGQIVLFQTEYGQTKLDVQLQDETVWLTIDQINVVRSKGSNGKYTNVGRPEFFPWQASPLSPMQFIGTYRYDGYSKGQSIYNVATDSKSVTSLGYHMPFLRNHRRSQQKEFGNTYQFYLWSSPR